MAQMTAVVQETYGGPGVLALRETRRPEPATGQVLVRVRAAGLNAADVERLVERIRILRKRGMTIIVVEHNMDLVMKIADRVLVMDYGQYLFEGTPLEVQANSAVIAAYLGA